MMAAPAAVPLYIEDTFSTYLYTGNQSTQTITNGIDLAGEGGLVWFKGRDDGYAHHLYDTVRGATKMLGSWTTSAEQIKSTGLTAFNNNGFTIFTEGSINSTNGLYASWTFRKAPKFFDVVTYTGTGANRTVAHNLGSVPGMIIVKRTDTTGDWQVYHRSGDAEFAYLVLNNSVQSQVSSTRWNDTAPTASVFSLGTDATVNASGGTYVAYLFAHDAGGFGESGTDNAVSCGSYAGNGSSTGTVVNLGYEPQWLLIKRSGGLDADWVIFDNMRGVATGGNDASLYPNLASAEASSNLISFTATGFQLTSTDPIVNVSSVTPNYIYLAIRRPNKPPTSGTQVFIPVAGNGSATIPAYVTNFPVDAGITSISRTGSTDKLFTSRLTGTTGSYTNNNDVYFNENDVVYDSNVGYMKGGWGTVNGFSWAFRRAPKFFDVVCYTGTGVARTVAHNLTVAPELMIVKKRSAIDNWIVYAGDATDYLILNTTAATADLNTMWNDTAPTSSVFSLGTNDDVNGSGATFVAYLFATLAGISKVGSYTGTAAAQTINCGFTGGARFVMIKRTDSTGSWYVWDTARGIIAGDDPYLLLNTTAAEVTNTDYIDPIASGFEISSTAPAEINAAGGSFIFLAIA